MSDAYGPDKDGRTFFSAVQLQGTVWTMPARVLSGADDNPQVLRNDDFVLVDLEGAPRNVMQISVLWQESNKSLQGTLPFSASFASLALTHRLGEFRRLFRPEETFEGRKPYHGDMELLLSTEVLVLPLTAIACMLLCPPRPRPR